MARRQQPDPRLAEVVRERFGDAASLESERPARPADREPPRPSTPAQQDARRRDAARGWR